MTLNQANASVARTSASTFSASNAEWPEAGVISSFAFGPFVFHTLSRRLERQGDLVVLNSRATELLMLLLGRAGELVTKDDLLQAAWGNRVVAENNLTVHMAALRRVLRTDDDDADRYIRTEHGRGYRFIMPVETTQAESGGVIQDPLRPGFPAEVEQTWREMTQAGDVRVVKGERGWHVVQLEKVEKNDFESTKEALRKELRDCEPTPVEVREYREKLRAAAKVQKSRF